MGALIGSILHVVIAGILYKKNSESIISKSFVSFFVFIAIAIAEISMYNILPTDEKGMGYLFTSLYIFSMLGIFSLVLGVRKLVFPKKNAFKTRILPVMIGFTVITAILTITDVTHYESTRSAIYTPVFIISFILNYDIPMGYIIYQLTKKRDWISRERRNWIKNLRYFFIINAFYPIIEGISGYSEILRPLDIVNGILIFTSVILLYSLPNYRTWYLDELKTITVIKEIERNTTKKIGKIWEELEKWQEEFENKHKQLTIGEFKGYLQEIEVKMSKKM